jgi:hypothetical protein
MPKKTSVPKKKNIKSDGSVGDILLRLKDDFLANELFFIRDIKIFSNELLEENINYLIQVKKDNNTETQTYIDFFYFENIIVIGTLNKTSFNDLIKYLIPSNYPKPIDLREGIINIGKKVLVKTTRKKIKFRINDEKDAQEYLKKWGFYTKKNRLFIPNLNPSELTEDFFFFGKNIKSLNKPKKKSSKKPQSKKSKKKKLTT